ncbi:LysR family transcriptional regulator [Aestuariibius sp. 2305UL40-4]|uniref:LysR family transcriptional regulator n=1 Tax=Aestuariibius violaceus TaxID=3234132 RepID=UPI00345F0B42
MNWSAISYDWNQVRAFLATVEEGSLSAAARALGLTQPTLGRQVTALEDALGVTLFERAGRSLQLTRAGRDLLDHVRAMGDAASRISLAASGQSQAVEGQVRVTASDAMSAYILPEALLRLREVAPLIEIEIIAADDIRDLLRREADIAIRHVRPEQPDLIARLVGMMKGRFYAAPAYLDRRGRPADRADLAGHDWIGLSDNARYRAFLAGIGIELTERNFRCGSSSGIVAWEMAQAGLGIAVMSEAVAAKTPGIEPVLPEMDPIEFPVWLTTHRELHTSRRIRIVFDLLAEFLAEAA